MSSIAAIVFALLILVVVGFQLALAAGAPYGHLAMGGRYPGKMPPPLRVAAAVQASLLVAVALVVVVRAGLVLPAYRDLAAIPVWVAAGISALSLVMNLATPSKAERRLWAPVAAGMVVTSVSVAVLNLPT